MKNNPQDFIYFDSHTHYNIAPLDLNLDNDMQALITNKVYVNIIGTDLVSSQKAIEIANKYGFICSVGIHPCDCYDLDENALLKLETWINEYPNLIRSIGECGLDYHFENTNKDKQIFFLKKQVELCLKYKLNLIIHVRDAHEDLINILSEYNLSSINVIIHCFSGDLTIMQKYLSLGYYISCAGVVTFKKAIDVQEAIKNVDHSKLLTETDSPFLAPTPLRGTVNNSNNVKLVNEFIANLKQIPLNELNEQLKKNFLTVFKFI